MNVLMPFGLHMKNGKSIDNQELRSYVNVLEDTRIDHLIQKKYPGVVLNYKKWFLIS